MFSVRNNFVFLCAHLFISMVFIFLCKNFDSVADGGSKLNVLIAVLSLFYYVGIACILSGNIVLIGNRKTELSSFCFISIMLLFVWLFCLWGDDGSFLSELVWIVYLSALGPFFHSLIPILGNIADSIFTLDFMVKIMLLLLVLGPSFLFWLGMKLKVFYLKKFKNKVMINL